MNLRQSPIPLPSFCVRDKSSSPDPRSSSLPVLRSHDPTVQDFGLPLCPVVVTESSVPNDQSGENPGH